MMSVFPMPASVSKSIDALRRNFLWQGSEDKKKFHLVKWEELIVNKDTGGLGIRNLRKQNQSLMLKWLWKFANEDHTLWKEVIIAKYGMEDKWMTKVVNTPYNCTVWRAIRNLWPMLYYRSRIKVGDGQKTSFWEDKWNGATLMKQLHLELYVLCQQQQATVATMWTGQGWNLFLRRHLNDWEIEKVIALQNSVDNFSNLTEEKDSLVWQSDIHGKFSVNSAYRALNKTADQETDWPWRMIWKPKVPYKVNCFLWLLSKEAVLTHENLKKRGYHFASRSTLCGEQAETINHLFLHCKWTEQLWRMFICLKGITWVKPGSIKGVLSSWIRDGNASKEERWKFVPACVWWTIWKERNNRSFENVQNSLQKIKMNCLALLYF